MATKALPMIIWLLLTSFWSDGVRIFCCAQHPFNQQVVRFLFQVSRPHLCFFELDPQNRLVFPLQKPKSAVCFKWISLSVFAFHVRVHPGVLSTHPINEYHTLQKCACTSNTHFVSHTFGDRVVHVAFFLCLQTHQPINHEPRSCAKHACNQRLPCPFS